MVLNIFWTGGFDSTFLIAYFSRTHVVKPIYICAEDVDSNLSWQRRNNKNEEINTMKKIKQELPNFILPATFITKCTYSKNIADSMKELARNGELSRSHSQYGAMATVSLKLNMIIAVGSEMEPHAKFANSIRPYVINGRLRPDAPKRFQIFRNLLFPVINLSKKDMYDIATKHQFDNILQMTFSCWQPINGQPCGNCNMCRERYNKL